MDRKVTRKGIKENSGLLVLRGDGIWWWASCPV